MPPIGGNTWQGDLAARDTKLQLKSSLLTQQATTLHTFGVGGGSLGVGISTKSSLLNTQLSTGHLAKPSPHIKPLGVIGAERKRKAEIDSKSLLSGTRSAGLLHSSTHENPLLGSSLSHGLGLRCHAIPSLSLGGLSGTSGPSLGGLRSTQSTLLQRPLLTSNLAYQTSSQLTSLSSNLPANTQGGYSSSHMQKMPSSSLLTSSSLGPSPLFKTREIVTSKPTVKKAKKAKINSTDKRKKKKKLGKRAHQEDEPEAERPVYTFDEPKRKVRKIEPVTFLPPEQDVALTSPEKPLYDVPAMKHSLINTVSASLIRAPDFKDPKDPTRSDLSQRADIVAQYDPEFILKVALYTRCELNIRTTGNFMLAYSAYNKATRPYLRQYFTASIRLPSDWIDVAEQYQAFFYVDHSFNFGSLPAALRRVMVAKFPAFDKYQLAKYNKESSGKKEKSTDCDSA